jgi:hypothetical protein
MKSQKLENKFDWNNVVNKYGKFWRWGRKNFVLLT